MLRFRKITEEDINRCHWETEPLSALLSYPDTAEGLRASVARRNTVIVMFDGETPAGFLEIAAEPTEGKPVCAVITQLAVLESYRRHGLGRMLMVLAADDTAGRGIWFLAAHVPETEAAQGFAKAVHMKQTEWYDDMLLLDLSDVEGLRHG